MSAVHGHVSFPQVDDHLLEPEITRDEIVGGRRKELITKAGNVFAVPPMMEACRILDLYEIPSSPEQIQQREDRTAP